MAFDLLVKAERLVADGKVRELDRARQFRVEGDTGTYIVNVPTPEGIAEASCTCPARVTCSHLYAVAATIRAESNAGKDPFDRVGA